MSATTSLHISPTTEPPRPVLHTYPSSRPIGAVKLDGYAITVAATDPAHLRLIAEAFTDAARQLADELDRDAARAMAAEARAAVPA